MPDNDAIASECNVFSRYTTGLLPDAYILKKYTEAFQQKGILAVDKIETFDQLLIKLSIIHPLFTQAVDIYSRFFRTDSVVRKRLIFLLAIAESWASTSTQLNQPARGGKISFILGITLRGLLSTLLLVITTLLLLPIQYLTTAKPEN